jgi:hypothetical protein
MGDPTANRERSCVGENKLRFTLSSVIVIALFAIIHFVVGFELILTWVRFWSSPIVALLGRILVNVWWFPAQQLYQLHHRDDLAPRFVFPVANSLLWGMVVFVIWKARRGQYFRFSVRAMLIATTVIAVLLGTIGWLER